MCRRLSLQCHSIATASRQKFNLSRRRLDSPTSRLFICIWSLTVPQSRFVFFLISKVNVAQSNGGRMKMSTYYESTETQSQMSAVRTSLKTLLSFSPRTVDCCFCFAPAPARSHLPPDIYTLKLFVPRTSTSTLGPRAFCSSGPSSWNALPWQLRDPAISINIFRQSLKTYLFNCV